jgi:hypothetical protein
MLSRKIAKSAKPSYVPNSNVGSTDSLPALIAFACVLGFEPLEGVRSESAVRPIGTERCRTGRAFGKSCRIDLIVLRISERLLPVMMEFQAAAYLSRDPYGIVCYVCLRQSI